MTAIIASATAYAAAPVDFSFDDLLFCSSDQDAAMTPFFCSKSIIQSSVCYLAVYSELTTKLFNLFKLVPTFKFIPRLMAVMGRMGNEDMASIQPFRNLQYICMKDCITDSSCLKLLGTNHPLMKTLNLSCCTFDDEGVKYIAQLHSLENLDLSENNYLRNATPYYIVGLKRLKKLSLASCVNISYSGFFHLQYCESAVELDLSGNPHLSLETLECLPPNCGSLILRGCSSDYHEDDRLEARFRAHGIRPYMNGPLRPLPKLWDFIAGEQNPVLSRIAERLTYLVYLDISNTDERIIKRLPDLDVLKEKCEFLAEVNAEQCTVLTKAGKTAMLDLVSSGKLPFKLYHEFGDLTEAARLRKEKAEREEAEKRTQERNGNDDDDDDDGDADPVKFRYDPAKKWNNDVESDDVNAHTRHFSFAEMQDLQQKKYGHVKWFNDAGYVTDLRTLTNNTVTNEAKEDDDDADRSDSSSSNSKSTPEKS